MNKTAIEFVNDILTIAPKHNKVALISYLTQKYNLTKDRSVYYTPFYAFRVCFSKNSSFSNTVLSLSMLQKYDGLPFFVILVRGHSDNVVYLANSSFLSKISHSSKELTVNNIKGSFNGSDILKTINNIRNIPDNFEQLFALHEGLDWTDNLERLVESSSSIKPTSRKFTPNDAQLTTLYNSVGLADVFVKNRNFDILKADLDKRCSECRDAILAASHIENVNLRGRLVEFLITADAETRSSLGRTVAELEENLPLITTHDELGDYCRSFDDLESLTDIKTKIIYLESSPKAYNIDKFLRRMSDGKSVFLFYFIGIDKTGVMNTVLCSVYHSDLIDASIVQHHWAGRSTRGVVQFKGKAINTMLTVSQFANEIDAEKAKSYLRTLLAL